ncbi:hypothetical protein I4U23_024275 [Adineta vaga]|nr:hypothetical protein I4U23_024275 [Adineta vaga]
MAKIAINVTRRHSLADQYLTKILSQPENTFKRKQSNTSTTNIQNYISNKNIQDTQSLIRHA